MSKTEKIRKSPSESATMFSIGTVKKGNDGNMWKIIATASGIHRWSKVQGMSDTKIKHNTTVKRGTKGTKGTKGIKVKPVDAELSEEGISMAELKKICERNTLSTSGASKSGLALRIYKIRSIGLSITDLKKIIPLLPSKEKEKQNKCL